VSLPPGLYELSKTFGSPSPDFVCLKTMPNRTRDRIEVRSRALDNFLNRRTQLRSAQA
jgi:hypothetical protein